MKMTRWFFCCLLLVSVSLAQAAETEEYEKTAVEMGKELHDANCTRCHNDWIYKRADRKIRSYGSLIVHVQRCATNLNKQWFEEEVADVAEYLNAEYYLFGRKKADK